VLAGFSGHGFKFGAVIGEAAAAALGGERSLTAIQTWAAGQG
jgi:glycine/D-amino acid oxidase-like deaminating enzyme